MEDKTDSQDVEWNEVRHMRARKYESETWVGPQAKQIRTQFHQTSAIKMLNLKFQKFFRRA